MEMEMEERSEKLPAAPGGAGEDELISQSTWGAVRDLWGRGVSKKAAFSGRKRPAIPTRRRPLIPTEGDHRFRPEGGHFFRWIGMGGRDGLEQVVALDRNGVGWSRRRLAVAA